MPPPDAQMSWLGSMALAASVALAFAAVWTDVRRREIPHAIVGGLVVCWVVAAAFAPRALNAPPLAGLVCGLAALGFGFVLYALGWLGGGDGKLLAAVAMWLGPADVGLALLGMGGVGLFVVLVAYLQPNSKWREDGVPWAVAIAPPAAVVLALRAFSD